MRREPRNRVYNLWRRRWRTTVASSYARREVFFPIDAIHRGAFSASFVNLIFLHSSFPPNNGIQQFVKIIQRVCSRWYSVMIWIWRMAFFTLDDRLDVPPLDVPPVAHVSVYHLPFKRDRVHSGSSPPKRMANKLLVLQSEWTHWFVSTTKRDHGSTLEFVLMYRWCSCICVYLECILPVFCHTVVSNNIISNLKTIILTIILHPTIASQ